MGRGAPAPPISVRTQPGQTGAPREPRGEGVGEPYGAEGVHRHRLGGGSLVHAGALDEGVDPQLLRPHPVTEARDGGGIPDVEGPDPGVPPRGGEGGGGGFPLPRAAHGEDEAPPARGQLARGLEAEAAVGAGDDREGRAHARIVCRPSGARPAGSVARPRTDGEHAAARSAQTERSR